MCHNGYINATFTDRESFIEGGHDTMAFFRKWQNMAFFSFVVAAVVAIGGGLYYMMAWGGQSLPVAGQAPNFTATDVTGKQVSLNKLDGKIRLVTWFYTNCTDACPITAYQMELIQNKLEQQGTFGKKVVLVSMTLDPKRDTIPVLQKWSSEFHANYTGWYFLRATPLETLNVLKESGIQVKETNPGTLDHLLKTELIDQNGNIRATYTTAKLDVNQVVHDINNLISRENAG